MMQETKQCNNCSVSFIIEPEDFDYYDKMQVPASTWCPDCRMMRRFSYRNERALHKSVCQKCNKSTFSIYHPDEKIVVYCNDCWWSDDWGAEQYGQDYNFDRPFFEQFDELYHKVPKQALWMQKDTLNSQFANYVYESRDAYLSYSVINKAEHTYHSALIARNTKNIFDSLYMFESENCYENIDVRKNFNCQFVINSRECIDSAFIYDCSNCSNCMLSTNLRNREYVFRNEQLSKEAYMDAKSKLNISSYSTLQAVLKEFQQLQSQAIHKYANILKSVDSTGHLVEECKNAQYMFSAHTSEDSKYLYRSGTAKDCYDCAYMGGKGVERFYEFINAGGNFGQFGKFITNGADNLARVEYIDNCQNISDCFGCIGLKTGQYMILNKQYTKEEYEEMIPRIKEHMEQQPYVGKNGRVYKYGEMFPIELSPFAYNEAIVQEFYPLTKDQALEHGYKWRDQDQKQYTITKQTQDLPDDIKDVDDSILDDVIGCEHQGECTHQCTTAFKVIKVELEMYRRVGLPLPRLCPNCRHYARVAQRNPLKLWHRQCQCEGRGVREEGSNEYRYTNTSNHSPHPPNLACPKEFETSYAPDRQEMVYCEQCYQAEVV